MTNLSHRYYGHSCLNCGAFNVSIDGLSPMRLNGNSLNYNHLVQKMLWSYPVLDPGRHTVILTHDGENEDSGVFFDFFRWVINRVKRQRSNI